MNKWFKIGLAVLIVTAIITFIAGYTWTWPTFFLSGTIIATAAYFDVWGLGTGFKKNYLGYSAVVLFVVAFGWGGLNIMGLDWEGLAAGTFIPGTTVSGPVSAVGCVVTEELDGKTSTIIMKAYDFVADAPMSATVSAPVYLYNNGVMVDSAGVSKTITAGVNVGDKISYSGGNATSHTGAGTYYIEPKSDICVKKEETPIEIVAYQRASPGEMTITCLDSDGNACSAGTNSSQENFDFVLGANDQAQFTLKLKNDGTNKAFNLKSVATMTQNDIDQCYPTTSGFEPDIVRDFLDVQIWSDTAFGTPIAGVNGNFTSGWESVWSLREPIMISKWGSEKVDFIIKSDADPANSQTPMTSDICGVLFLDASHHRGSDGKMYEDYYVHSIDEGGAGIKENITRTLGSQTGTFIEGI